MTTDSELGKLLGEWSGTNRLWMSPDESALDSATTALVSTIGQGQFFTLAYTWEFRNEPQDGMIVFRTGTADRELPAVWLDSWHMRQDIMVCQESRDPGGIVRLKGTYGAPTGPAWGWRIEIEMKSADSFEIRMFNITPENIEVLAVLGRYQRASATE